MQKIILLAAICGALLLSSYLIMIAVFDLMYFAATVVK